MAQCIRASGFACWLVVATALALVAWGPDSRAQTKGPQTQGLPTQGTKSDPSPFVPSDLKRPVFDTTTPIYHLDNIEGKSASTVVAEVDGRPITLGDVADAIAALPPSMKAAPFEGLFPGILTQLIRQEALVISAKRAAIDEDPAVKRRLKVVTDHVLAEEYLHHAVLPTITEQALLDRYNHDIAGKPGPEEVHVRVILAPTEQAANSVISELRNGTDFAVLAKQVSRDTTASVGGDLGFLTREGLNAEVGSVAFAIEPGTVAPYPVRTGNGWFVVKVEERRHRPTPNFFEVRDDLRRELMREGAAAAMVRSLDSVTVRRYDMNGKEAGGVAATK